MTYQEQYEELINRFIKEKDLSIEKIKKEGNASLELAKNVYNEWKNYHDEVYWHNAIYEISFMDEVPTPARIMNLLNISYCFAKELFDYFMEVANDSKEDTIINRKPNMKKDDKLSFSEKDFAKYLFVGAFKDKIADFYTDGWDKFFGVSLNKEHIEQAMNGRGNEQEKANVPHASALQSLVIFDQVLKHPIMFDAIKDEKGERIKFTKVIFEYQNTVIKAPSCVDVVLTTEDYKHVLFIESKFFEIVRDSVKGLYENSDRKSKYCEVSPTYYTECENSYKKVFNIDPSKKEYQDLGFIYIPDAKKHPINPLSNDKYTYPYGIKQFLCHIIGITNVFDGKYSTEISDHKNQVEHIYFMTIYNGLPSFGADQIIRDYKEHYLAVQERVKNVKTKGKVLPINFLGMMTYQDLYEQNPDYFDKIKIVKEFYKLDK